MIHMNTAIATKAMGTGTAVPAGAREPLNDLEDEPKGTFEKVLVAVFVAIPMLALIAAIPLPWGSGILWHNVILAAAFYCIIGVGITVGFHRYVAVSSPRALRHETPWLLARFPLIALRDAARGLAGREPLAVPLAGPRGAVAMLTTPDAADCDRALNPGNAYPDW
jgi:hypothetical protein